MLYLVDASVFIFRAWFSVPPTLTDPNGRLVNAVHGFARFLGDLLERERPEFLAVAFDESLTTSFRNEIYPAYKANREPAPEELKHQFGLCRELCRRLGLAEFADGRREADDLIGALAALAASELRPVTIVSRDKDLTQLLTERDVYWDAIADVRYRHGDVAGRFGARPERMADYLALTGDAVDNIPGVPGVGPKTAAQLLKHFDTLDGIYANLDAVTGLKLRGAAFVAQSLREHREAAFLSRRLTGIDCAAPPVDSIEGLRTRGPDLAALDAFYDAQGFGRMLRTQGRRLLEARAR
jgi:5'-3' exonuclease